MNTSRNTQKHVASLPQQAAQWYHEHSAILVAFGDLEFETEPQTPVTLSGPAGSWLMLSQQPSASGNIMFAWNFPRGTDDVLSLNRLLPSRISKFIMKHCCPHVPRSSNKFVQCFTEYIFEGGDWYRGHPNYHG